MIKSLLLISTIILCSVTNANVTETRTYNQPPVITSEFLVEEKDQQYFANLPKDTDKIDIKTDYLGIKQFKEDTFNQDKIKKRFKNAWNKLQEDESTVNINYHHR